VDSLLQHHNQLAETLRLDIVPVEPARKEISGNIYCDDFLISRFLHRPFPNVSFFPGKGDDWAGFDPTKALEIARHWIERPLSHRPSASALASVYLGALEALICIQRSRTRDERDWTEEKELYITYRTEAEARFSKLRMRERLKKIARMEIKAGILSREWGLNPIERYGLPVKLG
jgi:hypothetical protein